jgi:hypothetical protein
MDTGDDQEALVGDGFIDDLAEAWHCRPVARMSEAKSGIV